MSPFVTLLTRSSYRVILWPIKTKLQRCQSLPNPADVPQTTQWVTLQRSGGRAWSFAQRGHQVPARSQPAALKQMSVTQSALVCLEAFQLQTKSPLCVTSNLRPETRSGTWKERHRLSGKSMEHALLAPLRLRCRAPGTAPGSTRLQEAHCSAFSLAIRLLVCKRASAALLLQTQSLWHFCCLQAFLPSRKSEFYRALREVPLLQSSLFWVQGGLLNVCRRSAIWINRRTVRL